VKAATRVSRLAIAISIAAAALLAAFLPAPATAAAVETVDQGVVQASSPSSLTLRRLDGTTVTVAIGPATIVRVNGRPSSIEAVLPGFVARAFHEGPAPARLVRAVGTLTLRDVEGVVVEVVPRLLTLRTPTGETVAVRMGKRTVVQRRNGLPAARRALRPGQAVRARFVPGRVAELVVIVARS